jgi:uncharacterized protein YndB with AHSA1/START domain
MYTARVFRRIVIALAAVPLLVLAALGLVYAAQPHSFSVTSVRAIAAPPERVMAQLTDLRAYEAWDPWPAEPGATPTITYSVVATGLGAWIERRDANGGARTTIRSIDHDRVTMTNETWGELGGNVSTQSFEVRPSATGSDVTWTFGAGLHGLARMLWPVVHIDQTLPPQMSAALERLDRAATR